MAENNKRPSLDEIFSEQAPVASEPSKRPSLDEIFGAPQEEEGNFLTKGLDKLDSYTGVPSRAAAKQLLKGKPVQAAKDFADYYGTSPKLAPTAHDIQEQAGIPDFHLSEALHGHFAGAPLGVTNYGKRVKDSGLDPNLSEFGVGAATDWTNAIGPATGLLKEARAGKSLAIPGMEAAEGLLKKGVKKAGSLYQDIVQPAVNSMNEYANTRGLKTLGIKTKDARKLIKNKEVSPVADALFDEKLVKPFSTPESMHASIQGVTGPLAEEIHGSLQTLDQAVGKQIHTESLVNWLTKSLDVVPEAGEKVPPIVQKYLNRLLARGEHVGVSDLWDMRKQIDEVLKNAYQGKSFQDLDGTQKMLFGLRTELRELTLAVSEEAISRGMVKGDPGQLRGQLQKIHKLLTAQDIAERQMAGGIANRAFGLTDTIAGAAGLATGHTPGKAILNSVLATAGNKVARTYGAGVSATAAKKGAKTLADPRGLIKGVAKKGLMGTKGLLRVHRMRDE